MTVDELMEAIAALPPEELFQLQDRLEDHLAELWRRRLALDRAREAARKSQGLAIPYHSPVEPAPSVL
jgi:hypothetical protein